MMSKRVSITIELVSSLTFGLVFSLLLTKKTTLFYVDMCILINKTLRHFYML